MATRIRYEVWASDTGESSHWKPVRGGVFFSESGAIALAINYATSHRGVVVESWDDGRNVLLRHVWTHES